MKVKLYYNQQCFKTIKIKETDYLKLKDKVFFVTVLNKKHLFGNFIVHLLVKMKALKFYEEGKKIDTIHIDIDFVEGVEI